MSLYSEWNDLLEGKGMNKTQADTFWNNYLAQEKTIYEGLLEAKETKLTGTLASFGEAHQLTPVLALGFIDGINTSLTEPVDLESVTEETALDLTIDFEKLYFNMHKAKAEWLYTLPAWDDILSPEQQKEIKRAYSDSTTVRIEHKVGRNDPCPCGSGKKYKKCCLGKENA
ncbi:MAG: hypothetical protein PWQ12_1061 [Clostridiales bacterium]|nr:hypothetical protein [Clostridiales bacterium]